MNHAMEVNQVIHGFRVVSVREAAEPHGRAIRMIHERTGAELLWIDNKAENMVFSITFRTLPHDSTGVFHILEHSVLSGSIRYPVREPFLELLKSSMNTFLNAMTFPDMTMFPVSSRSFRDLMNLTRVYLDAVFHPLVISDPNRFYQEGWHIDRDENGKFEYRGVVFNEMKGAMSDPDSLMDRQIVRQLFPDTSYGYNSGGDPEHIPDLTWEQLREEYRKTYHPSNAYIYLDGAIDPGEMLETIYMSFIGFSRCQERPVFQAQTPVCSEETIQYEINPEEKLADHSHLTMARITGTWQDRAENLARSIICDVLTGSNEAPLKHDALEKGLCQDINLSVDDTGYQSWITIHADNVADGREEDIIRLIEETGRSIQSHGLDRRAAEASLNRLIFTMREDDEPQGISRCIRCMGTWLYGGDPVDALQTYPLITQLRKMIHSRGIDQLASNMLLDRNGMAILHTRPSYTIGKEMRKAESERLHRITDSWSDAEKSENQLMTEKLQIWQETADPVEMLKKLPMLTRKDADIVPTWTETEETEMNGVRVMRHRIVCNGVTYLRVYFPLDGFSLGELTRISFFTGMLGRLPTRQHDALTLQQEIKLWTGSIGFAVITRNKGGDDTLCSPYLMAFVSALDENTGPAFRLMGEILTQTCTDGQEDRIRDIMLQNEIGARQRIVSAGHLIAVKSTLSQYSAAGAVKNALDGEPAIRYIHRFASDPKKEMGEFMHISDCVINRCVQKKGMILSIAGNIHTDLNPLLDIIPDIPQPVLPSAEYKAQYPHLTGFRIPSQVSFTARGYRLSRCGYQFSGITWLTCSILSLEYLWNRIRVQGGSYGAGIQADRNGNVYSYSYRDPSPAKTLKADYGASSFIREFVTDENRLDKYIISSLNELNPLLSPREESALADSRLMNGISRDETERIRQEILSASGKDLMECAGWLDRFADEGNVCVAAPRKILKNFKGMEIFDI